MQRREVRVGQEGEPELVEPAGGVGVAPAQDRALLGVAQLVQEPEPLRRGAELCGPEPPDEVGAREVGAIAVGDGVVLGLPVAPAEAHGGELEPREEACQGVAVAGGEGGELDPRAELVHLGPVGRELRLAERRLRVAGQRLRRAGEVEDARLRRALGTDPRADGGGRATCVHTRRGVSGAGRLAGHPRGHRDQRSECESPGPERAGAAAPRPHQAPRRSASSTRERTVACGRGGSTGGRPAPRASIQAACRPAPREPSTSAS